MEGEVYVITLFDENAHLTNSTLEALKAGALIDTELLLITEHLCSCEKCTEALTDNYDDNRLLKIPFGFEEEVKNMIRKNKEKNRQFVFYSFRVVVAACIALIFVFSGTVNFAINTGMGKDNISPPNLAVVNSINNQLNTFSIKLINMEVFKNDKEKK